MVRRLDVNIITISLIMFEVGTVVRMSELNTLETLENKDDPKFIDMLVCLNYEDGKYLMCVLFSPEEHAKQDVDRFKALYEDFDLSDKKSGQVYVDDPQLVDTHDDDIKLCKFSVVGKLTRGILIDNMLQRHSEEATMSKPQVATLLDSVDQTLKLVKKIKEGFSTSTTESSTVE